MRPATLPSRQKDVEGSTEQVVAHVRGLIERGQLRPGDRLPAERDLALQIGVSRPTVRAGLRALAAMGVVQSRHGSGTYIPDGPPTLGSRAAQLSGGAARLHARRDVRGAPHSRSRRRGPGGRARDARAAGDARGRGRESLRLDGATRSASWCTTSTFIARSRPRPGNPIVASLVEMVSALYYERRAADGRAGVAIAICATRPRCTGGSTRRSDAATRKRRAASDARAPAAGERRTSRRSRRTSRSRRGVGRRPPADRRAPDDDRGSGRKASH